MLFNSFEFLLFFPLVTLIYFLLPHKFRWFHLLLASCVFYMFFIPVYIIILLITILIDYAAGIMIENAAAKNRKLFLAMSIVANVGVLALFKYYNFFTENINYLLHLSSPGTSIPFLAIILPIGLSFHTFQAMSYTIEVYRGNQKAERHLGIYALYVMFYPQLVAGPIERPQNMLHQFYEKHELNYNDVKEGLKLILWGLFKKVVIADRLALIVNNVYKHPEQVSGASLAIATIFFSFQIYCDFSGYSEIAIGTARVIGFKLMNNFNRPFFSKSVGEFWTRWHISLSSWFRDYLYIPLGGNRVPTARLYINIAIVFLLSGLWHGAKWTYIIWGGLHAFYLIAALITKKYRQKLLSAAGIAAESGFSSSLSVLTTFALVTFAFILFRANTMHDAWYIIKVLPYGWRQLLSVQCIRAMLTAFGGGDTILGIFNTAFGVILIILLEYLQYKTKGRNTMDIVKNKSTAWRWGFYYCLVVAILLLGAFDNQEFIYFQF
jgi:alginate O-acetyltransferase complex protein AlgI